MVEMKNLVQSWNGLPNGKKAAQPLLLVGPPGMGKTTMAFLVANSLVMI